MDFFGEIVEPSSRTNWEDWDEDNSSRENIKICFKKKINIPKNIETFILLEGKYLADLVKQTVCNLEVWNSIPEVGLHLYKIQESENYVCIIRDYDIIHSSEIVNLLGKLLTSSNEVISIITKPLVDFATSEIYNEGCLVRRLSTKHSRSSFLANYPLLEQPNIISGVAAGVVCLREHLEMSATALVFYTEHPEEHERNEVHKILEKFHIIYKSNPNTILNSNLYI